MSPNNADTWEACWERDEAAIGEEWTVSRIMDDVKFEYLEPLLPANGSIVEFGCGSARLLRFAAGCGLATIGIDFSQRALHIAQQASPSLGGARALYVQGDVRHTPFRDNSFDAVGSTGLLEHFEHPEEVIREMSRVLRPGGIFYSDIVPRKFSLYRALDRLRRNQSIVYERAMSRHQIEQMLRDVGLTEIRVFGAGVFPPSIPIFGRSRLVRSGIAKMVKKTLKFWRAFDGTRLGDHLGFYFFASARKGT